MANPAIDLNAETPYEDDNPNPNPTRTETLPYQLPPPTDPSSDPGFTTSISVKMGKIMESTNTPSPKRPSPPPAAASTASGVTRNQSLEIKDDDIDLQLQLGKFNPSAAPNDDRLPPPPKKRKTTASSLSEERWSVDSSTLVHDGYDWRKYGQKEILNSKYPRHYFRCTHRHDKGCLATKQVQRVSEDPPLHRTTYFRKHTCNQSSFLSSSISYVSQAADEHTREYSIVFEKQLDEDDQQPSVLIGFEQQPEEHTQQLSMAHEPSSLSSSISYVAQPRGIVKHTQQHGTAHEFVQQSSEGVVTDVVKEPTLHVNGLCSTSLPSPTSTSKEQADSVISELTTTTTDPAEFGV